LNGILAWVFCIGEQIAVGVMDRAERQAGSAALGTECFNVLDVEHQFDDGLPASLAFGGFMQHYICSAVACDQFDDPIAGQSHGAEAEMRLVELRGFLDIPGVNHQSIKRQKPLPSPFTSPFAVLAMTMHSYSMLTGLPVTGLS
jgi:hypothetical protein